MRTLLFVSIRCLLVRDTSGSCLTACVGGDREGTDATSWDMLGGQQATTRDFNYYQREVRRDVNPNLSRAETCLMWRCRVVW